MQNFPQTVLSQYSNSTRLLNLLSLIDQWISPDANFELFYNRLWNIDTATGYGLDVWGRIIGVKRTVRLLGEMPFGFYEATDRAALDLGPFWEANIPEINYELDDDTYRRVILTKAAYNITDGGIPSINALMRHLFPFRGNAYVLDGRNEPEGEPYFGFFEAGDRACFDQGAFSDSYDISIVDNMSLIYVFEFALHPFEVGIVTSGVLPKPTGVQASYRYFAIG